MALKKAKRANYNLDGVKWQAFSKNAQRLGALLRICICIQSLTDN